MAPNDDREPARSLGREGSEANPRRRFLNWLLTGSIGGLAASILYPVFRFVSPPRIPEAPTHQVEAGTVGDAEFVEPGFKIVRFGSEPVLVIRAANDDFRAFAATCTHLDCIVEYQSDKRRIWCNCHNGEYNLFGEQVAGPPPRPLAVYEVALLGAAGDPARRVVVSRS